MKPHVASRRCELEKHLRAPMEETGAIRLRGEAIAETTRILCIVGQVVGIDSGMLKRSNCAWLRLVTISAVLGPSAEVTVSASKEPP